MARPHGDAQPLTLKHLHTPVDNLPDYQVCGVWEEGGGPEENPEKKGTRGKLYTKRSQAQDQTRNSVAVGGRENHCTTKQFFNV